MGDNNTIGLLTNINNSLGKIVEMMLPQNQDAQTKEANKVKNLSQGGLSSGGAAPSADSAGAATELNGINLAQITSALDGLPEQVKAIAKLSGRTINNFTKVLTSIIKIFASDEMAKLDKKDAAAAEVVKAVAEFGKLPDAIKDVSKLKDKDVEKFCNLVVKIMESLGDSLKKTKVSKEDIQNAKNAADTILTLTTAMKSLTKMTLIAPLAMIGLIAVTPVWIAFGLVLSIIGLLEKPIQRGIRALRQVDRFMNRMMKTALLGLAVAGGVLILGMFVKNNVDTMLFGLAGLTAVFLAVGVIAILGGLIGLLIKSTNFFDKQIIKFTLELMLIAGLTIALGMLLEVGWKQALLGLGGMVVVMLAMLGIAVLINIVGAVSMESIRAMAGVLLLMIASMVIAASSVLLGKYLEENIESALIGFAATTLILGEVIGIALLAKRVAKGSKSAVKDLLMAEGVILGAMAIIWATVKTGELVWDYFGTDTGTALAKVAIVFAVSAAIITGAWGVTKIANRAKKDIQKGALALLLAEGVILASAAVAAAVIGVSLFMEKTKPEDIMLTLTVMAGIVAAAGAVAAVASKFQSTIMKGALVMALLEVLILGMVGVMYAIVMTAKAVNNLKNGWVDILFTVTSMASLVLGFTAFGVVMGAMCANPYVLAALTAGAVVLGTLALLIAAVTGATMLVVKLAQMMEKSGKTTKELGELLHSVTHDVFSYENLNPDISVLQAVKLSAKYLALMPALLGITAVIGVVSMMARQFGGLSEYRDGKYFISPYYGMNGNTPVYGQPVNVPEIAEQIVTAITLFSDTLYKGFKDINLVRLTDIGLTIGLLVDPVSKFAQMLTGLTNGKQEGTLKPVFITNDGEIRYGAEVKVVEVATLIARSISAFATELFGDGDNLPQWMMFTRKRKGRKRVENAMNTLALIVEPVDTFVQLLTSYQSAGPGMLRKISIDENGNINESAPLVNVVDVAKTIATSISTFGNIIFGDDADWMKTFKKVDDNGDSRGSRAMKSLALVVSPISAFVDALIALEPEGDKLYAVTVDDNGISHKRPVDVVSTATQIAKGISIFVSTLFADSNVSAWENMIKVTKGSMMDQATSDDESSGGAVGVLSVVIDPISNFVKALMTIGGEAGENGELLIPVYDKDGKLVEKRPINLVSIAQSIANAVTVFVSTLFSPDNQKMWLSLMYGYNANGELGSTRSTDLQDSVGVFAAIIDPVVKFMEILTLFGGTPDKFQIFDGKESRTINLIEVSNAIALAITTFVDGLNPALEKINDFDAVKKQMIGDFAVTLGKIIENFAKVGETKKEQIDLASTIIDTYFITIDKITEKLSGDLPDIKVMNNVDAAMQKAIGMIDIFKDIKFDELNYQEGFDTVLTIFTRCKDISDLVVKIPETFSFKIIQDFTDTASVLNAYFSKAPALSVSSIEDHCEAMRIISVCFSEIQLIPDNDESRNRLWFVEPFVHAAVSLKQMLVGDSTYAQNAAMSIELITYMGNSMLMLSNIPAKELDDISNAYNNLLSRVIKLSNRQNSRSIIAMNNAIKDATVQMTNFDQRLVKHADDRKKKFDELIEAVSDLNDKLETTSTRMGKIADTLTTISKLDSEKLKENANAINFKREGSSGGSTGEGGSANGGENSGAYIDAGSSLTQTDITVAIQRALDMFSLDFTGITLTQDNTINNPGSAPAYKMNGQAYVDNDIIASGDNKSHRYENW